MSDTIEREITIAAPVERVWELITRPEHVGTWFGDAGAEIDLRPGGAITLRWEEYGTVQGRIERIEPMTLFSYRWAPFDDPGRAEPGEGNSTLIEFMLSETGDGTRLRVIESGFSTLATTSERQRDLRQGNFDGWKQELGELADYAHARV